MKRTRERCQILCNVDLPIYPFSLSILPISLYPFSKDLIHAQNPNELEDWLADLNPNSKTVVSNALAVPHLADVRIGDKFQFERLGELYSHFPPNKPLSQDDLHFIELCVGDELLWMCNEGLFAEH
jgi:hypothetical protein